MEQFIKIEPKKIIYGPNIIETPINSIHIRPSDISAVLILYEGGNSEIILKSGIRIITDWHYEKIIKNIYENENI